MASGRFRELMKKYGKVALGVHLSVSAASITGLYVAIKNNVDVESLLDKVHMGRFMNNKDQEQPRTNPSQNPAEIPSYGDGFVLDETPSSEMTQSTAAAAAAAAEKKRNRTAELAASSGGALALAVLVNKALFPIRVPITIAVTPPIARFLARRKIMKTGV